MRVSSDSRSQTRPSPLRWISAMAGSVGVSHSQPMTAKHTGVTLTPSARRLFRIFSVSASDVSGRVSVMGSVGMALYYSRFREEMRPRHSVSRQQPIKAEHGIRRANTNKEGEPPRSPLRYRPVGADPRVCPLYPCLPESFSQGTKAKNRGGARCAALAAKLVNFSDRRPPLWPLPLWLRLPAALGAAAVSGRCLTRLRRSPQGWPALLWERSLPKVLPVFDAVVPDAGVLPPIAVVHMVQADQVDTEIRNPGRDFLRVGMAWKRVFRGKIRA